LQFAPRVAWRWQPFLMSMAVLAFPHDADAEHPAREHIFDFDLVYYPNAREQRPREQGLALSFFRWKHGPQTLLSMGLWFSLLHYRNFSPHLSRKLRRQSRLDPNTDTTLNLNEYKRSLNRRLLIVKPSASWATVWATQNRVLLWVPEIWPLIRNPQPDLNHSIFRCSVCINDSLAAVT
jgi:hypothetical protein